MNVDMNTQFDFFQNIRKTKTTPYVIIFINIRADFAVRGLGSLS